MYHAGPVINKFPVCDHAGRVINKFSRKDGYQARDVVREVGKLVKVVKLGPGWYQASNVVREVGVRVVALV